MDIIMIMIMIMIMIIIITTSKPFTRPVNVFSYVFFVFYIIHFLEELFFDRNITSSEYLFLTNTSPAPIKTGLFSPFINSMFCINLLKYTLLQIALMRDELFIELVLFTLLCAISNGYLPFIYLFPCLPHTKAILLELLQNTTKKQKRVKSFKFLSFLLN